MKRFILASASPRRRELLKELIAEFTVVPSQYEEIATGKNARETVELFAYKKAEEVASRYPDCAVLGSDTVVSLDGVILGKPKDREEAARVLRSLSGRTHAVYTGISLFYGGRVRTESVETKVTFYPLSEELITRYVESGLPLDKAGSYGIQDGFDLVEKIEGSYSNVVGLPIERLGELLKEEELC